MDIGIHMTMIPLDYGRSFLLGTWPQNEVRFWVESRTRIVDERNGRTEDYVQCASCKSEDTFAEKDLFYEDNYDFLPIFGPEYGLIFRRKACLNPDYRTYKRTREMWDGPEYHLEECPSFQQLTTPQDSVRATLECRVIVAQTEIQNDETGLRAILEYPVKTLNTRREDNAYQIDTGPVAFPDLGRRPEKLVELFSLAFVAFNAPSFADFVIEVPTLIDTAHEADKTQVYHYSQRVSLAAKNRLYAVT